MPIKLNRYSLSGETINQMKTAIHKSLQTKLELGFTLCTDQKNNLNARNICTGEKCSIRIEKKCDEQETYTGEYHTHP